jgi:archaellin
MQHRAIECHTLRSVLKNLGKKKTSREKVENEIKGHIGARAVIEFYGKMAEAEATGREKTC